MGQSSPQMEAMGCGNTSSGWETQCLHKVSCDCLLPVARAPEAAVAGAASSFSIKGDLSRSCGRFERS